MIHLFLHVIFPHDSFVPRCDSSHDSSILLHTILFTPFEYIYVIFLHPIHSFSHVIHVFPDVILRTTHLFPHDSFEAGPATASQWGSSQTFDHAEPKPSFSFSGAVQKQTLDHCPSFCVTGICLSFRSHTDDQMLLNCVLIQSVMVIQALKQWITLSLPLPPPR